MFNPGKDQAVTIPWLNGLLIAVLGFLYALAESASWPPIDRQMTP